MLSIFPSKSFTLNVQGNMNSTISIEEIFSGINFYFNVFILVDPPEIHQQPTTGLGNVPKVELDECSGVDITK